MNDKVEQAIKFCEEKTGYQITYNGEGDGRLITGLAKDGRKLAYIYGDGESQLCHELGHLICDQGIRPVSKIALVIREMEAWRAGEALMHKFDMEFDVDCFDMGFGTYLFDLLMDEQCPSVEWVSQLIGE